MKTKTTGGKSAKKSVGGKVASTAKNNTPASVQTEEPQSERCTPVERELSRLVEADASPAELREFINEVPGAEVEPLLLYCKANHDGTTALELLRERNRNLYTELGAKLCDIKHERGYESAARKKLDKAKAFLDEARRVLVQLKSARKEGA